jgi:hypothetical protein
MSQLRTMTLKVILFSKYLALTSTFAADWERFMSDYEPDYVYMIPLAYKTKEHFFENITHVPARVRGAFLIDDEKKDEIEFEIVAPDGHVVYHNTTNECIFEFNLTTIGRYMIVFNNRYVNSDIRVTFTMNTGQNPILKKDDLSFSDTKLDSLLSYIHKFNLEYKFSHNLHYERYRKIQKTNKYFYTFSIIETIVLMCISIWQFYYMRQLFEIKATI